MKRIPWPSIPLCKEVLPNIYTTVVFKYFVGVASCVMDTVWKGEKSDAFMSAQKISYVRIKSE
jgi:hypothetical protein